MKYAIPFLLFLFVVGMVLGLLSQRVLPLIENVALP